MRPYEGKEMNEELLKGLTDEQIAKAKACKNSNELLQLAKAEGVELNEEQLAAVSGGICSGPTVKCPKCGNKSGITKFKTDSVVNIQYRCEFCGTEWIGPIDYS